MYFSIHQNTDLCHINGFAFSTLQAALQDASKRLGMSVKAVPAEVRVEHGPNLPCYVAVPTNGLTGLCREGQMTLLAESDVVISIAMYLTRRNGPLYGVGKVVMMPTPNDATVKLT